jgi:hypothetical protein
MIEKLSTSLAASGWRVGVTHREAAKFQPARVFPQSPAKE